MATSTFRLGEDPIVLDGVTCTVSIPYLWFKMHKNLFQLEVHPSSHGVAYNWFGAGGGQSRDRRSEQDGNSVQVI